MEQETMVSIKKNHELDWCSKTFLVVEDDPASMELIAEILKETRVNIIKAHNGVEAINLCIKNEHIDLVLLDIMLPVLNGYAALKEIRKHRANLPVIAQTAYAMTSDKAKCLEAGCNDFISKPLDSDELINKILTCITSN